MVVCLHCLLGLFPASPLGPTITADASGAWGCGAYEDSTFHWFQVTWPNLWEPVNIAAKELFPFLVAVAVWGQRWQGSKLRFHSDNQAAVLVLNRGSAKDPTLAHLLHSTAQKRYISFCSSFGLSPLPLTERSLCLFAAFLAIQGPQASSIMAYLSAVRHLQIPVGRPSPTSDLWPWLHYVSRGIKRSQNQPQRVRLSITTSILKQLGFPITMASRLQGQATVGRGVHRIFQLLQTQGATAILKLHPIPSSQTWPQIPA